MTPSLTKAQIEYAYSQIVELNIPDFVALLNNIPEVISIPKDKAKIDATFEIAYKIEIGE